MPRGDDAAPCASRYAEPAAGCCAPASMWVADGTVGRPVHPPHRGGACREDARAARAGRARAARGARRRAGPGHARASAAAGAPASRSRSPSRTSSPSSWRRTGEPLRTALEWERRSERAARRARARATGPSSIRPAARCSWEPTAATPDPIARLSCSPRAGSRRATAPRCPGCCRAAATRCWCQTEGNGTRFDLGRERTRCRRAPRGAAAARVLCAPTPAARLRALCRLTGFPALLPEWGYGFWKSRDVYEHQDDVLEDFDGFRRARGSRSTRSCSTRRGRRNTTPGSSTRTSSPTPAG